MIKQNTPEWLGLRLGKVTASKISCIIAKGTKSPFTKRAETYALDLLAEEFSGLSPSIKSFAIDWGNEHEADARAKASLLENRPILEVGFEYNEQLRLGASADGVMIEWEECNDTWIQTPVEFKCPFNSANHLHYALSNPIDLPAHYWWQVQAQILIYDAPCGYFYSYDPRNKMLPIVKKIIHRSPKHIEVLKSRLEQFLEYKDELKAQLLNIKGENDNGTD